MTTEIAEHAIRFQSLLQMHGDQPAVELFQFLERPPVRRHIADPIGGDRPRLRQKRHSALGEYAPRFRIHALQPQQPILEIAGERLNRCSSSERPEHRRA